jgi:hypothetical protein
VPAAAVIRARQALLTINGSKGYVGGIVKSLNKRHFKCVIDITILESKGVTNKASGV